MRRLSSKTVLRWGAAAIGVLLVVLISGFAQDAAAPEPQPADTQQPAPSLSANQLDNLVAPIALYPDPLLSQVLSASTYPLEVVEAQQWLRQNGNLKGSQLMEAARQQNWDPSVQALVAFPDALGLLANDIRWTTDLGNAFLAQQADVMSAVQRMRARARANGRLATTPQQVVTTAAQDGQDVIEIEPANPQVIYVPIYSPAYVWGPPVWGYYPDLWYPAGFGFGFGFGPAYYMSAYFPGWGGWGGWGWGCGWFGRSLYVNVGFFNRYGFRGGYFGGHGGYYGSGGYYGGYAGGGRIGGRVGWMHDPGHRMGVPYPNRAVAGRFGGSRFGAGGMDRGPSGGGRTYAGGGRFSPNSGSFSNRGGLHGGAAGDRSSGSGQWRSFGGNRAPSNGQSSSRGFAPSGNSGLRSGSRGGAGSQQTIPNTRSSNGWRNYASPSQGARGYGSARNSGNEPSTGRSFSRGSAAPGNSGSFSSRSYAAPNRSYSAPGRSYSAPPSVSSPRGYGGGFRSTPAPSRSYSAPRSFSSPRSFGGGGFSAPSRGFSAPRSFSSPRMSGGGGGFSGGRGFSGGHGGGGSFGGRGGGGRHR
ncbi:MAG: DUF3300 domain-containing protein [Bryobacterales bacterium]|nr:DUF3300 domain-containing protein [Bryobacterales bacterium]